MRCFITGGTGFVGSHIVRTLVENGNEVTVLIRDSSSLELLSGLEFSTVVGDVTDPTSLMEGIPKDAERIFHNAAVMTDWGGKSRFFPVNVEGTRNVLEIARKKDIPGFIQTSSTAVYGFPNTEEPLSEDAEWAPMNNYQKSKAEAEKLVMEYEETYGIKATRIRPPVVLGHGDMYTGPFIIERMKEESMVTFGGGENRQSFAHAEDVASCLALASEKLEKSEGHAFNVTSFTCQTIELFNALADELGVPRNFRNFPYTAAVGLGKVVAGLARAFHKKTTPVLTDFVVKMFGSEYIISMTKAQEVLGYEPKWSLKETVKDMVEWGGFVKPR